MIGGFHCDSNSTNISDQAEIQSLLESLKQDYGLTLHLPDQYKILRSNRQEYIEITLEAYEPFLFWEENLYSLSISYYPDIERDLNVSLLQAQTDFHLMLDMNEDNPSHLQLLADIFPSSRNPQDILAIDTIPTATDIPIFLITYREDYPDTTIIVKEAQHLHGKSLLKIQFYARAEHIDELEERFQRIIQSMQL